MNLMNAFTQIHQIHIKSIIFPETPKTYQPQVPTCNHGFPKDQNYDPDHEVSIGSYDDLQVTLTKPYPTTAPSTHEVGFRNCLICSRTTIAEDKDVFLGRNTWPPKQTRSRTKSPSYRTYKPRIKPTCHHGLEITNDHQDTKLLRALFERIISNDTLNRPRVTYKRRTTQAEPTRNVTRTRKTRRPRKKFRKRDVVANLGGEEYWFMPHQNHFIQRREVILQENLAEKLLNVIGNIGQKPGRMSQQDHAMEKRDLETQRLPRSLCREKNNVQENPINSNSVDGTSNRLVKRSVQHKRTEDGGHNRGSGVDARVLGQWRNVVDLLHRNRRSVDSPAAREKATSAEELGDLGVVKPLQGELLPAAVRRVRRQFEGFGGSAGEYVDKNAKDKVYRSYEQYEKRRRKECDEDRICRLFKEDLARQDSFDGWNPNFQSMNMRYDN